MDLTEVKVKRIPGQEPFLGFAKVVIDDAICIKDIRILKGNDGDVRIVWPSRKRNKPADDGRNYEDICYPINKKTGRTILEEVVKVYHAQGSTAGSG